MAITKEQILDLALEDRFQRWEEQKQEVLKRFPFAEPNDSNQNFLIAGQIFYYAPLGKLKGRSLEHPISTNFELWDEIDYREWKAKKVEEVKKLSFWERFKSLL